MTGFLHTVENTIWVAETHQASVDFHTRLGFVQAGRLHESAWKLGQWYDSILMELLL